MTNLKARITKPLLLYMSKKMMMTTPEEVLNSVTEGINAGDLDSLMTLYEADACFATQPGQLAKSLETIRQSLRGFTDIKNGKFDLKVKRVLQASDLALVISEWSFSGTGPDGNPVNIAAKKSTEVLRQQADGTWRFVIDNPWGTE
ncbi:MAG TPA: SgcJ/EcaC family oxidoreductase [Nitrososphaeraceae archaeon]|nr:SgcJ/EcaC family oxidoreductase [Nitrososphaeraceae archaeon]